MDYVIQTFQYNTRMNTPSPGSAPYRRPGRPQSAADAEVLAACDALFREGVWPSADALVARLGGSKGTVHRIQRQWRAALPQRFAIAGPAALERVPEQLAQLLEALWIRAKEEAREAVRSEDHRARDAVTAERQRLDLQHHVLSLREEELQRQLKDARARSSPQLTAQLSEENLLLKKLIASRGADASQIKELKKKLTLLTPRSAPRAWPKKAKRSASKRKASTAKPRRTALRSRVVRRR
jgi:hypothetical protein